MGWGHITWLLPAVLALILLSAGIEDARLRTIGNGKNLLIALLAPLWWHAQGLALWPDMAWQLALALAVFALFCGAFAAGAMGGGDVKLIGALALWLPFGPLMWMLMAMSIAGGALTVVMMIERAIRKNGAPVEVPYGVAIVAAALLALPRT